MRGRRRQSYEYFRWLKEAEREIEALERQWELGIVRWRDEKRYRAEIEPFNYDFDAEFKPNILRVIR
jgi:hypothetical protein